ncbi:MAG: hypothetical protein EHM70_20780 [Chloroflexota bacterium]|nr:MAG: hypothetical protein EHM70_20780 [Chloroflexota bacterium]
MRSRISIAVLFVSILLAGHYQTAAAHGHTEVGNYELVIGFHNEPAYQGEPNGLDLFVTNIETGEPVNGLEETLQVEIIYGSSKKELSLEPQFEQDGAYTAHVIPSETGDYTWHIFGIIEGMPVDVSMTSSPETFGSVEAKSSTSFPGNEAATGELASQADSAARAARIALVVAAVAAVLGLAGLVFGILTYQATHRQAA